MFFNVDLIFVKFSKKLYFWLKSCVKSCVKILGINLYYIVLLWFSLEISSLTLSTLPM